MIPEIGSDEYLERSRRELASRNRSVHRHWKKHDDHCRHCEATGEINNRPYPDVFLWGAYLSYVPALEHYAIGLEKRLGIDADPASLTQLKNQSDADFDQNERRS